MSSKKKIEYKCPRKKSIGFKGDMNMQIVCVEYICECFTCLYVYIMQAEAYNFQGFSVHTDKCVQEGTIFRPESAGESLPNEIPHQGNFPINVGWATDKRLCKN